MKLKTYEEAVSPVIAVILMVAITVVLAAVVYVWVSGFNGGQTIAGSISLQNEFSNSTEAKLTVTSASPSLSWTNLQLTLDGVIQNRSTTTFTEGYCILVNEECSGTTQIQAGQTIWIKGTSLSGKKLFLIDSDANSIIATYQLR